MRNIFSPDDLDPRKRKRFNIPWKKLFKIFGIIVAVLVLATIGVFAYFFKDLPDPGKINNRFIAESTKIYDRTGTHLLYDVHGEEKRTQIAFSQMPDVLKYATISLEDQDFYSHHGIKFTSIVRSMLADIIHLGKAQGGSTITQQFVKNSLLSNEKTLIRKVKEVILSLELETKFSKDDILAMYLNEIPYGSNAYGIEAAAQTFFGKSAKDLTLDESAVIASLPQATTYYSPYGSHTDALIGRKDYALKTMARLGYITQDQANEAINTATLDKIKPQKDIIAAPHFVMYIKDYLQQKYGDQAVEQGGLKVYTTLDWDKQQLAEKVVKDGATKNTATYKAANAGLVAMDPKTGQVLAMVGSKDYFAPSEPAGCISGKNCVFEPNVNVAVSLLQPGSSFKPYVYLTAFEKGFTPETNIWDTDTNFNTADEQPPYDPKNYDGKNSGLMQMKDALARSLNVPAVKTLYLAGVTDSINTARSMGITTLTDPTRYGLSLVLGGGEVKLLDHVNAFSTFATDGIHHPTTAILRIEDSKGTVLEKYNSNQGDKVIDEKYVAMIDYIMSTNSLRAPVFGDKNPLSFDDRAVAAKTGTTNEWRDGWTMGYTPSLAVGVWAGNNDHSTMKQGADGIFVAAPIWRAFMNEALKNTNKEDFPKYEPEDAGKDVLNGKLEMKQELKVCEIPGKNNQYCLASDACPDSKAKKKNFSDTHDILYYVNKDDVRGDPPKNPENDPQFKNWEAGVKSWLKDNGFSTDGAPTDKCQAKDFSKYQISIDSISHSGGDPVTSSSFSISVKISAPYGVKKATISVDGNSISSSSSDSFSASYDVPSGKYNSSLDIKVDATDNNGNSDSKSTSVSTNIPAGP
ncbi:MAG: transglycosylase domain-containing protein [Candidatus Moranbacteria bacterium]|nr:transglycosylase domain-containing protein [Candidatus Moranbacteria bacterium]